MAQADIIKDIVENYLTLYENQYDFLKNKYKNDAEALNFLTRFVRTERVSRDGKKYISYRFNNINKEGLESLTRHAMNSLSQAEVTKIINDEVEKIKQERKNVAK